jgi:hypothetical protein
MRLKCTSLILLFILPLFNSCINNADFDQIDLNADPIVNIPLVFFELNQLDFLDDTGNVEIQTVTDISDLDFFESATFREDLRRADFFFEIRNTFPRGFRVQIDLLDINDNSTYSFATIFVGVSEDFIEFRENIIISEVPNVLNTRKLRITINLPPSSEVLDPDVEQVLEFKSAGIFYLTL